MRSLTRRSRSPETDQGTCFVGAAAALHHYRLEPGVESPGREETLHGGPEKLARGVVDVGLE